MKKLARLVLFFSLCFVILLVTAAGFRFLSLRVQWMRYLPGENEAVLTTLIASIRWALSVTLYGSLLLSLSYAARLKLFVPLTVACVVVLSLGFGFGVMLGLESGESLPPRQYSARPLGGPGLILSQADTSVVLLKGPQELRGPRVTAIADRPLVYQAEPPGLNNAALSLPPLPLGEDSPWFLKSMAIDFRLNAELLQSRLARGLVPFFIYAGALVLLLASLSFLFKLSVWPMANLFLGALVFRLILSLETLFNSPEMQDVFAAFLGNRLPASLTVPLVFCAFGLLVYIYSILVYLAKRRRYEED